jgi:putative transposase
VGQTGFVDATPSSLYKGHRYAAEIISHCVWLYHRFPLSLREVEEMMMARGVLVTYETIHQAGLPKIMSTRALESSG